MNRVLAVLAIGVSFSTLAIANGCGSSQRDGYNSDGGPGGPSSGNGGEAGAGFGSGNEAGAGSNTLNCLGLDPNTKSSAGCDYYTAIPDVIVGGTGACFAAFITNTYTDSVAVGVEYGGQSLDVSKFAVIPSGSGQSTTYTPITNGLIPAGQVAILFLNRFAGGLPTPGLDLDCPTGITPAITNADVATHGTALGQVFHIMTSAAVAAYDIYPYGGGQSAMTSATLLLPTTSWDTNYIAVDAYGAGPGDQPFTQIVAEADGTQVTIKPTVAIAGGTGVAATAAGVPQTYSLNKGQLLQFTQDAPLIGSVIQSNNPIGVWGGKSALEITSCCDDTAHQQIPPVRALGNEYVGVRYRNRYDGNPEETPPWRLVGAVDGTTLTWEPSPPTGAPTSLDQGQVVEFNGSGPFTVRAQDTQHPFYMSAHMDGAEQYDPNQDDGRGDPEFVNVIPPGEYQSSYIFFTDPTYPETNLVLVRTKGASGFADVTLDCAGVLTGWAPADSSGNYEYTRIDLVRHNFASQNGCNNGRHEIHSDNPFGLTVWGWGSGETGQQFQGFYTQYVSYAYPGGANVQPINNVVVPANVK